MGKAEVPNRREFIRIAAGVAGAGAATALSGCGSAGAHGALAHATAGTAAPRLKANRSQNISKGVQHFRSRTDLLPPEIIIGHPASGVQPGVVLTEAHAGVTQQGPLIMDRHGRLLYFRAVSPSPTPASRAFNVRVQSYRGKRVLTYFSGAVVSGHGQGHYEIYNNRYQRIAEVFAKRGYQGDLHEFLLTDRGTALFTCYGKAAGTLPTGRYGNYWYGVVQEVDVATGKLLFLWRSDRHVPLSASYQPIPSASSSVWDYFHINCIAIDPSDGNLLISSRNTWACYKVHRKSGRVMWKLGGKGGDFKMGPRTHFAFQHDVVMHPGGRLTMFDNEGGPPNESSQSRGLVLSINERRRRATFVRQYHHHPPVLSQALGSVEPLAGGHVFMGWGDSSHFTEYDAHGRVKFDGHLTPGTISYRAFKNAWTGVPTGHPALAATRSGTSATLYASWNGATEITHWGVWGGSAAQGLKQLGTASWLDFETAIHLPNAPSYLQVIALNSSGHVLGRSPVVSA